MKYHNIINGKLVLNPEEIIENMWNDLTITINPAFLETLPSFIEKVIAGYPINNNYDVE